MTVEVGCDYTIRVSLECYDSTYNNFYQYFTKTLQELSFQGEEVTKVIPQILHFPDTLEADFTASVRSFFLPGRFITFKRDNEWNDSLCLDFIFLECDWVWLLMSLILFESKNSCRFLDGCDIHAPFLILPRFLGRPLPQSEHESLQLERKILWTINLPNVSVLVEEKYITIYCLHRWEFCIPEVQYIPNK